MIFLITGTMDIPFDRLIRIVDDAVGKGLISEDIFGQIGESKYVPRHFSYEKFIDKDRFDSLLEESSMIISHAGMGAILQAQERRKPIVLFPRYFKFNEHVNDHQVQTALKFKGRSFIETVFDGDDFIEVYQKVLESKFVDDDFWGEGSIELISNEIVLSLERMTKKDLNIVAGASSGGHLVQLLKILDSNDRLSNIKTVITTLELMKNDLESKDMIVHTLGECNREKFSKLFGVIVKSCSIRRKTKPDVIISTGALPLAIFCFFSFLRGTKIIWIDSIANIDKISMSGRFIKPFCQLFLTQWSTLDDPKKNIRFCGSVI